MTFLPLTFLKSFSKTKAAAAERGELRPSEKPDVDNYIKDIKDGLNKVLWQDDSQMVDLHVSKFYSEKPRIEIKVTPIILGGGTIMSFIDFKAIVKKVNMKPKGLTEITLKVNSADLDGKIQHLSEMIDQKVESQLESTLINYNVEINPNTNEPTTSY